MGTVRIPSLGISRTTRNPGVSRSTRNAEIPRIPLDGSVAREAEEQVGDRPGGDPGLAAVQDPSVAPTLGPGLHAEDVRARLGLAGAVGPEQAAVAEAGQIPTLLVLGAELTIGIVTVQSAAFRAKIRPESAQP